MAPHSAARGARRCGAVVLSNAPPTLLRAAVARYQALGIWGRDPILPRTGYDRLKAGLVSGHFVKHGAPFEQAVDNSLAEEVVREDPPPLEV